VNLEISVFRAIFKMNLAECILYFNADVPIWWYILVRRTELWATR